MTPPDAPDADDTDHDRQGGEGAPMTITPEPAPESSETGRRRGGRSRLHRRVAGALAIGLGLVATAGLYTACLLNTSPSPRD